MISSISLSVMACDAVPSLNEIVPEGDQLASKEFSGSQWGPMWKICCTMTTS